jgi:hypothetical protein
MERKKYRRRAGKSGKSWESQRYLTVGTEKARCLLEGSRASFAPPRDEGRGKVKTRVAELAFFNWYPRIVQPSSQLPVSQREPTNKHSMKL